MEFLKSIISEETYGALEKEINDYCSTHDEKIRLVNVSSGEYVKKGKLDNALAENERLKGEMESLKVSLAQKDTDAEERLSQLQAKLDAIATQEAERAAEARLNERFNTVRGTNEFINSFTENGVRDAFKAAVNSSDNTGKSDAEIYSAIVGSMGDVYKNPHKPNDIPPMGGSVDEALDAEKFKGMSLEQQMQFANTHSEQYQKLFKE